MSNQYFSSAADAASFVIELLRNDFQHFTAEDRVQDPDGVYARVAEIKVFVEGVERYFFSKKEREALALFAEATPAERARAFRDLG